MVDNTPEKHILGFEETTPERAPTLFHHDDELDFHATSNPNLLTTEQGRQLAQIANHAMTEQRLNKELSSAEQLALTGSNVVWMRNDLQSNYDLAI